MAGFRLSDAQIAAGVTTLAINKQLKQDQVDDLVSVFRGYLAELADNYDLETTFAALQDTINSNKCAKFAACLILMSDNEFINGGFAATNANRTGLNYSIDQTNYDIFRYMMGLLWTIPNELDNRWLNTTRLSSSPSFGRVCKEW